MAAALCIANVYSKVLRPPSVGQAWELTRHARGRGWVPRDERRTEWGHYYSKPVRGSVWTLSLSLILLFQVGSQGNSLFPLLSIFKALAAISKKSKAVDCVGLWLPDRKAMKTFQTNVSSHSCPTMEKNLSRWQQQITKIASSASTIPHSPLVEDCPSTGSPLGSHDDTSPPPEQHLLMSMSKIWWSFSIVYRLFDTDGHQRCYFHLLEKKRSFSHWKDFGNMIGMKTSSLSPHWQKQQQTKNISTHLELKENYKGELGHSEKGEEEGEENQQTSENRNIVRCLQSCQYLQNQRNQKSRDGDTKMVHGGM